MMYLALHSFFKKIFAYTVFNASYIPILKAYIRYKFEFINSYVHVTVVSKKTVIPLCVLNVF